MTNVTASAIFKPICGEAQFCFKGLAYFLLYTWEGWSLSLGTILSALAAFVSYFDKEKIDKLEEQLATQADIVAATDQYASQVNEEIAAKTIDVEAFMKLMLEVLCRELKLAPDSRISVYQVSSSKYFIIGRYSPNNSYAEVHRFYYSRGVGVLEKAWEKGWHELEIAQNPKSNPAKYCEEHKRKCNVPVSVSRNFTMKSRSYRAMSLQGFAGKPVAIVCVETTQRNGLAHVSRSEMEAKLAHLQIVLEVIKPHLSSIDDAAERGF